MQREEGGRGAGGTGGTGGDITGGRGREEEEDGGEVTVGGESRTVKEVI